MTNFYGLTNELILNYVVISLEDILINTMASFHNNSDSIVCFHNNDKFFCFGTKSGYLHVMDLSGIILFYLKIPITQMKDSENDTNDSQCYPNVLFSDSFGMRVLFSNNHGNIYEWKLAKENNESLISWGSCESN